ncbi:MAG TPA: hypothetical protein VLC98_07545 [Phnomibacter sp.]|nr:hypothetical protein [Phnomibacter sp.]
MNNGYLHPLLAEASLPLTIPPAQSNEMLRYQIISTMGNIIRQGCFKGGLIYISTRLLPKGERYLLRIVSEETVLHEGRFETLQEM